MGLLDIGEDPLMGLATGLLSASGPSRMPVSFGQALGAGVQGMQETKHNAMRNQMTQFQMEDYKRKVEQQKAMQEALQSAPPEIQRAAAMGVPMEKIWERMNPEAKWVDGLDSQGRPVKGWATANGFQQVGGSQAKPVEWKDTGSGLSGLDPYTGLPTGQALKKGVSPDAAYSGGITMRGQNMTDLRGKESNAIAAERLSIDKTKEAQPKPLNESQGAAANFGVRAAKAHSIIAGLEADGVDKPGVIKRNVESIPLAGEYLASTGLVNWTQSDGQQQVEQAKSDFISAVLRKESGASISPLERSSADKQYFPQPGDSEAVKKQKAANRQAAIDGLAMQSGPAAGQVNAAGGIDLQAMAAAELARRGGK